MPTPKLEQIKLKPGDIKPGDVLKYNGGGLIPVYFLVVEPREFKDKANKKLFYPETIDAIIKENGFEISSEDELGMYPQKGILFVRDGNRNYFATYCNQFGKENIVESPQKEKRLAEMLYREKMRKLESIGLGNLILLQEADKRNA